MPSPASFLFLIYGIISFFVCSYAFLGIVKFTQKVRKNRRTSLNFLDFLVSALMAIPIGLLWPIFLIDHVIESRING
jgi:peptide subunit release factor RF-3